MKFRIHHESGDSIIIEADTLDELRKEAEKECEKRGWNIPDDVWSEKLTR